MKKSENESNSKMLSTKLYHPELVSHTEITEDVIVEPESPVKPLVCYKSKPQSAAHA